MASKGLGADGREGGPGRLRLPEPGVPPSPGSPKPKRASALLLISHIAFTWSHVCLSHFSAALLARTCLPSLESIYFS